MTGPFDVLQPEGWAQPVGYANGMTTPAGKIVFTAGQVGWNAAEETFPSLDIAPQFKLALENIVALVAEAGGRPEHIVRITAYCTDKAEYEAARREIGRGWREVMGRHYPTMTMVFISALYEEAAKIELEATAVIP